MDVFRVFVADFELGITLKRLFDGDRQVNDVERVGAQVVYKIRLGRHLVRLDFELSNNNIPDAFESGGHVELLWK